MFPLTPAGENNTSSFQPMDPLKLPLRRQGFVDVPVPAEKGEGVGLAGARQLLGPRQPLGVGAHEGDGAAVHHAWERGEVLGGGYIQKSYLVYRDLDPPQVMGEWWLILWMGAKSKKRTTVQKPWNDPDSIAQRKYQRVVQDFVHPQYIQSHIWFTGIRTLQAAGKETSLFQLHPRILFGTRAWLGSQGKHLGGSWVLHTYCLDKRGLPPSPWAKLAAKTCQVKLCGSSIVLSQKYESPFQVGACTRSSFNHGLIPEPSKSTEISVHAEKMSMYTFQEIWRKSLLAGCERLWCTWMHMNTVCNLHGPSYLIPFQVIRLLLLWGNM